MVQARHFFVDRRDLVGNTVVHFLNVEGLNKHGQPVDLPECARHLDKQHCLSIDVVVTLGERADRGVERLMQLALTRQQIVQVLECLLTIVLVYRIHSDVPFRSFLVKRGLRSR